MSTPVVMPQMGESIAEGTIVRWIKKVGDTVDRDEPLFEISTDKVDAEIPSPAAGVLTGHRREGRRDGSGQQRRRDDRRGRAKRVAPTAPRCRRRHAQRRRAPATSAQADGTPAADARRRQPPPRGDRSACTPCTRAPAPAAPSHLRCTADERPPQVLAAGPPHREGTQRRHRPDPADRASAAASPSRTSSASSTGRAGAAAPRARPRSALAEHRARAAGRDARAGRRRVDADVGDAQEDRRAHGAQQAHLGARLLGLRGRTIAASTRSARRRRTSTSAPAPS